MSKTVVYVHGKGGNAEEAERYKKVFGGHNVIGFDYKSENPWTAREEFLEFFNNIVKKQGKVIVAANSIGAYFCMNSIGKEQVERAFFISPVVDMERLICDMMSWAGVTERELCERRQIKTDFGETLSWEYLCYVRDNPVRWEVPTCILYGEKDNLTSMQTIEKFACCCGATLTVMPGGEHWFHTEEQLRLLDDWIKKSYGADL